MGVAVSSGAVLRALNKEHGPKRITRSSYGILQKIYYDPDGNDLHKSLPKQYAKRDPVDGIKYVHGITWHILKVCYRDDGLE